MRKCCKKKMKKREDILEIIELVDKLVSHKMKNINIVLPALMAVITPFVAYFFTDEIKLGNIKYAVFAIVYGLVIFLILLWAHFPVISRRTPQTKSRHLKEEFSPYNLVYSAYLSNTDFIKHYEIYFNRSLTQKEKISVSLLKNKINEMRFRTNCLAIAFGLIIAGIIFIIIFLVIGFKVVK